MERLQALVEELFQYLPQCFGCKANLYEAKVYVLYSCTHFLCQKCATRSPPVSHLGCVRPVQLRLDYVALSADREELADALGSFLKGSAPAFPRIFAAYFRLLGRIDSLGVPGNARNEVNPDPVSERKVPAPYTAVISTVPQDVEMSVSSTWTCHCGTVNSNGKSLCSGCKWFNLGLKRIPPHQRMWTCLHCRYQQNGEGANQCAQCGSMKTVGRSEQEILGYIDQSRVPQTGPAVSHFRAPS